MVDQVEKDKAWSEADKLLNELFKEMAKLPGFKKKKIPKGKDRRKKWILRFNKKEKDLKRRHPEQVRIVAELFDGIQTEQSLARGVSFMF